MDMDQGAFYMLILFFIYLFINSEVAFIRIFNKFEGASDDGYTTNTYGTIIQGILLTMMYFFIVFIGDYLWDEEDVEVPKSIPKTDGPKDIQKIETRNDWKSWIPFK
jgi:hypothetical protein